MSAGKCWARERAEQVYRNLYGHCVTSALEESDIDHIAAELLRVEADTKQEMGAAYARALVRAEAEIIERCAKVCDDLERKTGNPNGWAAEQYRDVSERLRALVMP